MITINEYLVLLLVVFTINEYLVLMKIVFYIIKINNK